MDGFWQNSQDFMGDRDAAIGYYAADELPFYYRLLENSALCAPRSFGSDQEGSQSRNPPLNAFSLSPRRLFGGNSSSSATPPPPMTT
jgi:hypothetical protein